MTKDLRRFLIVCWYIARYERQGIMKDSPTYSKITQIVVIMRLRLTPVVGKDPQQIPENHDHIDIHFQCHDNRELI